MPRLFPFSGALPVTKTIISSQPFTVPAGVTKISLTGKGEAGSPATSGHYEPNTQTSTPVTVVTGHPFSNASASGGQAFWENYQGNAAQGAYNLNNGFNSYSYQSVDQYTNGYINSSSARQAGDVVPGSAFTFTIGGWKSSGAILPSDSGSMYLAWQEYGPFVPGSPATTGASTTGFGKTFPGGTGGAAPVTSFGDVPVTPGQTYSIVIANGGYLTLSYVVN